MFFKNKKEDLKPVSERKEELLELSYQDFYKLTGMTKEDIARNNFEFIYMNDGLEDMSYHVPGATSDQSDAIYDYVGEFRFLREMLLVNKQLPWDIDMFWSQGTLDMLSGTHRELWESYPDIHVSYERNWKKQRYRKYLDFCHKMNFKPTWKYFISYFFDDTASSVEARRLKDKEYSLEDRNKIIKWGQDVSKEFYKNGLNFKYITDYDIIGIPEHIIEDYINGIPTYQEYFQKIINEEM